MVRSETSMPRGGEGEEDDRKPLAKDSISRQGAGDIKKKHNAMAEASEPSMEGDGYVKVVDDFFAIDRVVDWRGEKGARMYRIRWQGQPPDQDDWIKPKDLCHETLREAHALVRADKAQQKAGGKESIDGTKEVAKVPSPPIKEKKAATEKNVKVLPRSERKKKGATRKDDHPPPQRKAEAASKETSKKKRKTSHASLAASKPSSKARREIVGPLFEDERNDNQSIVVPGQSSNGGGSGGGMEQDQQTRKVPRAEQGKTPATTSEESPTKKPKKKARRKRSKKDTKRTEDDDSTAGMNPEERIQHELARGNDIELVDFQPVVRINVNEENAKARVSEARTNGIPIVLTGHLGWPQFASRWLKDASETDPLDLSRNHELNIANMIRDIGDEEVPIVEKNYDERDPTATAMKASIFLEKHWPKNGESQKGRKKLYMQQWQFPYSDGVANILCGPGMCNSSPGVFYEDLLPFWLDQGGNPYQYLFMGDTGTMSKLHKDPGGLDIHISPIVGEKECILGHRLDESYLYNLRSKLDKIDLNQFPLTAFSRVWKTTIKPGEILVMPHDTYHQCRNVTPCLSYHRLHLDAINLRGFLDSMYSGDAKNMEHTEVLWNTSSGLMERVESYLEMYKRHGANDSSKVQSQVTPENFTEESIAETVKVLQQLRCACLGLARFLEGSQASHHSWLTYKPEDWKSLVGDIGETLHDYRNRDNKEVSRYRRPNLDVSITASAARATEDSDYSSDEEGKTEYNGKWHLDSVYQALESSLDKLPYLRPYEEDLVIYDSVPLKVGDEIQVRLRNRRAKGTVKKIDNITALLVSYDNLPSSFDEFQPRTLVHGRTDASRHAIPSALRPSLEESRGVQQAVRCIPSGDPNKQLRRAKIVLSKTGTFYHVELKLDDLGTTIRRWMCRDSFIQKID